MAPMASGKKSPLLYCSFTVSRLLLPSSAFSSDFLKLLAAEIAEGKKPRNGYKAATNSVCIEDMISTRPYWPCANRRTSCWSIPILQPFLAETLSTISKYWMFRRIDAVVLEGFR